MEFVLQGGEKGATNSWPYIILSNLNRFIKIFTTRFLGKFAVKWILNFPPHLAYVPTLGLPREKLMSAKQVINDKLQGSVAAYLRCRGVVNNQIKKNLLLSLWVKKNSKSVNIWQSYQQKRDCLVHFLRLLAAYWPGAQSARCGGICNKHLTTSLTRNLPVNKFCKSVKIWQNYGHESLAPFCLAHPV